MAVETLARLRLTSTGEGGLNSPLQTPTQSLVFRPTASEEVGLVGIIRASGNPQLVPGSELDVDVLFPEECAERFVAEGESFILWNGRNVGTAEITQLKP